MKLETYQSMGIETVVIRTKKIILMIIENLKISAIISGGFGN